jgi:hypothetical protein
MVARSRFSVKLLSLQNHLHHGDHTSTTIDEDGIKLLGFPSVWSRTIKLEFFDDGQVEESFGGTIREQDPPTQASITFSTKF